MVDSKLIEYIKRHLQKGYKKDELQKILIQNGWSKDEVNEAFKSMNSKQQPAKTIVEKPVQQPVKQIEKPVQVQPHQEHTPSRQDQLAVLKNFILSSRSKKLIDFEIKNALRSKGWPEDLLEQGFRMVGPAQQIKQIEKPVQQNIQPKPMKEKKPINVKKIIWFFVAFIIAAVIITGTILVFNYVLGLSDYTISQGGEDIKGKCLELDCSDMKEFAFSYAQDALTSAIMIGLIASLIIVLLYAFLPFRNVILWVVNGLYFVFLVYIGYIWIAFSSSI
nr:hypothetical protein [Nanoarchaeum sp.]